MNKRMIHLAGLTLAALIAIGPALAQEQVEIKKRVTSDRGERPERPERAERLEKPERERLEKPERTERKERLDAIAADDGPLALARSALGDAERNVKQLFAGSPGPDRTTIVSSSATDEKTLATLDEDMNIMARILDKAVNRDDEDASGDHKAMGIQLWALGGGKGGSRNLYVDGHGAIFILNVNALLVPPADKPKAEEKKESSSTSWEEARRELYGRENGDKLYKVVSDRPYDGERVEALKKNVAEALKNASNIRGLGDHEYVTVMLQGHSGGLRAVASNRSDKPAQVFAYAANGQGGGRSVMTIRAKKADVDAFAKGKIELDDFRKKLTVTTYQTAGGGETIRYKVGM